MAGANSSDRSRKSPGRQRTTGARKTKSASSGRASKDRSRSSSATKTAKGKSRSSSAPRASQAPAPQRANRSDGLAGLTEQLAQRILKPLGLVVLSRERIAETLDEAADQGRLTRSDADRLVAELVQRGRQQTEELLSDLDRSAGRGRQH